MKAYLEACGELERKQIELDNVEKDIGGPTLAYIKKDSASRTGEKYRPKERKGRCNMMPPGDELTAFMENT